MDFRYKIIEIQSYLALSTELITYRLTSSVQSYYNLTPILI
jgi:hypothetical protein